MSIHEYIYLREEDRFELQDLIRRGESGARVQSKALILLLSDRSQGRKHTLDEMVEKHVSAILSKLEVNSRVEAAVLAVRENLF